MSVNITTLGYLIIPISLAVFLLKPRWLFPLTVLLAPFQASSVIDIYLGDYPIGLQPGYLTAILFLASILLGILIRGKLYIPRELNAIYLPLLLFVGYCVLTAIIIPTILQNQILVLPPRAGLGIRNLTPLKISGTNLSQTFYLMFLFTFAFFSSLQIAQDTKFHNQIVKVYLLSGLLVILIGFYQVIAWHFKLPFPNEIIYSNPGYRGTGAIQSLSIGLKRLSSTLAEPSIASYYLSGLFAFSLSLSFIRVHSKIEKLLAILSFVALLMTTSTTAYLILLLLIILFTFHNLQSKHVLSTAIIYALIFILISSFILSIMWVSGLFSSVPSIINEIISEKPKSISFTDRFGADIYSLGLIFKSFGFGVGWGSNRSSSLITNLFSNAGLWGVIILLWFTIRLVRHTNRAQKTTTNIESHDYIDAYSMSIITMLLAGFISIPDTIHLFFWVNLSILIGFIVHSNKKYLSRQIIVNSSDSDNIQFIEIS